MSRTWTIVTILAAATGCGGGPLAGSQTDAVVGASQCRHDPSVGTGAPGACGAGRALFECRMPNGGCDCITDGTTCNGCETDATCANKCNANEYAAACGSVGPPDPSITYANPPAACRIVYPTPAGVTFYCCPCL
jgi:hypothetical protein